MTQEQQQRIKIAEVRGWLKITKLDSDLHGWQEQGPLEPLPNYPYDLNAMHDAESVLNLSQWDTYESHLKSITAQAGVYSPIRATAAQRAKAFLKTLNLWTEE